MAVCDFLVVEVSNPPSAPTSEKQSPLAQQQEQRSPKTQPAGAAVSSQPGPGAAESAQSHAKAHQSPVSSQLPAPPTHTCPHEGR